MTAPGCIPAGDAPELSLDPTGVGFKQAVVSRCVKETAVVLVDAEMSGFVQLRVGPLGVPNFPDLYGCSITLDAAACRHLARLLDAKADELAGIARGSA